MNLLVNIESLNSWDEEDSIAVYAVYENDKKELWRVSIVDDPQQEAEALARHYTVFAEMLGKKLNSIEVKSDIEI